MGGGGGSGDGGNCGGYGGRGGTVERARGGRRNGALPRMYPGQLPRSHRSAEPTDGAPDGHVRSPREEQPKA